LKARSEICRVVTGCDFAPPSDEFGPEKAVAGDRPVVDQAAFLGGENDNVVVDGVSEADLRLGASRGEDQVLGLAAYPTHDRAEGEDQVTGELALLREFVPIARKDLLRAATVCNWSSPDRARG
jgi:hypothetical protein